MSLPPDPDTPVALSYDVTPLAPDEVRVEWFEDGGATITWPAPPKLRIARWKAIGSFGVGLSTVAVALWAAGTPLGAVPSYAARLPVLMGQAPLFMVVLATPLMCWGVSIALRLRQRGPTVVGITPREVYFDVPGLLFRRRARVPRAHVREIRLVRWTRSLSQQPRCIQILISGRVPVTIGDHRPPREIARVMKILEQAMRMCSDTQQAG